MKLTVILLTVIVIFEAGLRGEEVLVTTSGKFTTQTGAITLNVEATQENHLKYTITLKQKKHVENVGEVVSKKDIKGEIPITVGEWAICLKEPDEVWFYLGKGSYTHVENEGLAQCLSPEVIEGRAPAVLKYWVKTRPSQPLVPTPTSVTPAAGAAHL